MPQCRSRSLISYHVTSSRAARKLLSTTIRRADLPYRVRVVKKMCPLQVPKVYWYAAMIDLGVNFNHKKSKLQVMNQFRAYFPNTVMRLCVSTEVGDNWALELKLQQGCYRMVNFPPVKRAVE